MHACLVQCARSSGQSRTQLRPVGTCNDNRWGACGTLQVSETMMQTAS